MHGSDNILLCPSGRADVSSLGAEPALSYILWGSQCLEHCSGTWAPLYSPLCSDRWIYMQHRQMDLRTYICVWVYKYGYAQMNAFYISKYIFIDAEHVYSYT